MNFNRAVFEFWVVYVCKLSIESQQSWKTYQIAVHTSYISLWKHYYPKQETTFTYWKTTPNLLTFYVSNTKRKKQNFQSIMQRFNLFSFNSIPDRDCKLIPLIQINRIYILLIKQFRCSKWIHFKWTETDACSESEDLCIILSHVINTGKRNVINCRYV